MEVKEGGGALMKRLIICVCVKDVGCYNNGKGNDIKGQALCY